MKLKRIEAALARVEEGDIPFTPLQLELQPHLPVVEEGAANLGACF